APVCGRHLVGVLQAEQAGVLVMGRFFFSSRRRHTRLQGDWSSDVCSSDLSIFSLGHTFAELTPEEKAQYSHRGKAFRKFLEWYRSEERRVGKECRSLRSGGE